MNKIKFLTLTSFIFSTSAALSQADFINEAQQRGVDDCTRGQEGFGFGAASADFDNDGDIDIFLATPKGSLDRLYRNIGNGHYVDVAEDLGLRSTVRSRAGLWFDYDGDQRLDLLITSDCYRENCENLNSQMRLYKQSKNGTFIETTDTSGLKPALINRDMHRSGAAAGDLNGDGYLDLVTGFWEGQFYLYLNQGNGTFRDVSIESGIGNDVLGHWQPIIHDFNGDGLMDIYSTIDFTENKLWINSGSINGIPQLIESAIPSSCNNSMNDMGVTIGDFDEDGDPDIYATNIFRKGQYNVLLQNDTVLGKPFCTEVSDSAVVRDGGWGWGASFFDANNDTYLDIAETNGWRLNGWEQPPRLFMNQPNNVGTFVEKAAEVGMTSLHWGTSLLSLDIDRDGDLDLVESVSDACYNNRPFDTPLAIYVNQLDKFKEPHNYLVIKPRIHGVNARAIGAKVQVEFSNRTLSRWITAGTSILGQEPAEAFFGLADVELIDTLTITWPDEETTVVSNVAVNQELTVTYTPRIFKNGFERL